MAVYHLPLDAFAANTCFSVISEDGSELLVIPFGSTDIPARFDGFVYLPWSDDAILAAPISPRTLVPESLAAEFSNNPVLISSQICGGTLESRLEEARLQYADRLFFCIEPLCHLLPLPCPSAEPAKISASQSHDIRSSRTSFYSDAFCCDYCVDPKAKAVHLFDTHETIRRKIELAESLGIEHILCLPT